MVRLEQVLTPPIFFPWEIIDPDTGEFVAEQDFRRVEGDICVAASRFDPGHRASNYPIFKAIWTRAQREIADAEKVSFVGLSVHSFLQAGLRFLFKLRASHIADGRKRSLLVITANPDSMAEGYVGKKAPRNAHVDRLQKMLIDACPGLRFRSIRGRPSAVVCYKSFEDFIRSEL